MSAPLTLDAALTRLRQYGEHTSTWSTATYNDGTEKALHQIALTLAAEVDRLSDDLTGASLSLWEDEQEINRLRSALKSAQRGRRELRARVAEMEADRSTVIADRDGQIIAWLGKKAGEYRSAPRADQESAAGAIARMADKLSRGAVRPPLSRGPDPLVVSRYDTAMEPAPEDEQVFIVGAIDETGRPVALQFTREDRAKVGQWLTPKTEAAETLADAITAVEDPEQRRAASGGDTYGWESARDVLNRLLRKATTTP